MANLILFKKYVRDVLQIAEWSPTTAQLEEIARRFRIFSPESAGEALEIVQAVCPPTLFHAEEGVDNSDIRALLALAIAAAKR